MPYRRYRRTDPRRYVTRARLAAAGHPETPAMLCLALIASGWTLMGLGVGVGVARSGDMFIHTHIPDPILVAGWIVPALLACYLMLTGKHSTITVAALTFGPTVRLVSYLWAYISYLIPGPPDGVATAWYTAAFHVIMLGLVVLAAMLTRTKVVVDSGGGR